MSIHEKFATLLNRIAVAPNIARARHEDEVRLAIMGESRAIELGVARAVERLEKRVADLEKALA